MLALHMIPPAGTPQAPKRPKVCSLLFAKRRLANKKDCNEGVLGGRPLDHLTAPMSRSLFEISYQGTQRPSQGRIKLPGMAALGIASLSRADVRRRGRNRALWGGSSESGCLGDAGTWMEVESGVSKGGGGWWTAADDGRFPVGATTDVDFLSLHRPGVQRAIDAPQNTSKTKRCAK